MCKTRHGGHLYIKGDGAANFLGSPMWDYSHMGGAHQGGAPALVGSIRPTRGAASPFSFSPFYLFSGVPVFHSLYIQSNRHPPLSVLPHGSGLQQT